MPWIIGAGFSSTALLNPRLLSLLVLTVSHRIVGLFATTNSYQVMWSRHFSYEQAYNTLHDGMTRCDNAILTVY